jgi:hypothetical protein
MTERPQYGEFASPEQQAKAMGKPWPPVVEKPAVAAQHSTASRAQPLAGMTPGSAALTRPRRWDVTVTVALLVYGLYSVIAGFFQFRDLGSVLNGVFAAQGIGDYTPTAQTTTLGTVIMVSNVVIYAIAVAITLPLLRRGKLAFYVPLIAGALAGIVVATCMVVLIFADPAFIAYANGAAK